MIHESFDQLRVSAYVHRSDGAIACLVANEPVADDQYEYSNFDCIAFNIPNQAKSGRFERLEFGVKAFPVHPPQDASTTRIFGRETCLVAEHDSLTDEEVSCLADEEVMWRETMRSHWDARLERLKRVLGDEAVRLSIAENGNSTLDGKPCIYAAKAYEVNCAELSIWVDDHVLEAAHEPLQPVDVLKALACLPWMSKDMHG